MNKLYVIGNGFDLAHGIPSRYSDFCKYMCLYHHKAFHELGQMYDFNNPSVLWCDFEQRLGCPDILSDVQNRLDFWQGQMLNSGFQQEIEIGNDCDEKIVDLGLYFRDWIKDTLSQISCDKKFELDASGYYLSFNYTSLLEDVYQISPDNIYHIHHNTGSNPLYKPIVGHGCDGCKVKKYVEDELGKIPKEVCDKRIPCGEIRKYYEDLLKSTYKDTKQAWDGVSDKMCNILSRIDEVYILGHSMSKIDGYYFEEINKSLPCHAKINVSVYHIEERNSMIASARSYFKNRQINCDVLDNLLQESNKCYANTEVMQKSRLFDAISYRYEKVLILGNGFNNDINLKIDYQDYFQSDYWNCIKDGFCGKSPLVDYIKQNVGSGEYNIEGILDKYVKGLKDSRNKCIDKKAFDELELSFQNFVQEATQYINLQSKGIKVLKNFECNNYCGNQNNICSLYSFNYTNLKGIFKKIYDDENSKDYGLSILTGKIPDVGPLIMDFIHGCANYSGHIILGINAVNISVPAIARDYEFLEKQKHPYYCLEKKLYFLKSLGCANEIIFFGFSFSDPDRPYFEDFFKMQLPNQRVYKGKRKVTIYTLDKTSGDCIKANISKILNNSKDFFYHYFIVIQYADESKEVICDL